MRTTPLRGQVGGGWALEIETFWGSVKWHQAVREVPFGAQKGEMLKQLLIALICYVQFSYHCSFLALQQWITSWGAINIHV